MLLLPGLRNLLAGLCLPLLYRDKAVQFSLSFLTVTAKLEPCHNLYSPSSTGSILLHLLFDFKDFIQNSGIFAVRTVPANVMVF